VRRSLSLSACHLAYGKTDPSDGPRLYVLSRLVERTDIRSSSRARLGRDAGARHFQGSKSGVLGARRTPGCGRSSKKAYLSSQLKSSPGYLKVLQHGRRDLPAVFSTSRWKMTSMLRCFLRRPRASSLAIRPPIESELPVDYFRWDPLCQPSTRVRLSLAGYILSSQGDRMAMAHSVEAGFPFWITGVEFAAPSRRISK